MALHREPAVLDQIWDQHRIDEHGVAHKQEIEQGFGEPLEWKQQDGVRRCRIAKRLSVGGYGDEDLYPHIFDVTVDAMICLEWAINPFIQKIVV